VHAAHAYAATSHGRDVMFLMGGDFSYSNAVTWYKSLDKLIAAINKGGVAEAAYSTPERYVAAKAAYRRSWPLRTDDLFPYADSSHTYWTGAAPWMHDFC
jgi:alpha-mannosidase